MLRSLSLMLSVCLLAVSCKVKTDNQLKEGAADTKKELTTAEYNELCKSKGVLIPDKPHYDKAFWVERRSFSPNFQHFAAFLKTSEVYLSANQNGAGCVYGMSNQRKYMQTEEYAKEERALIERYKENKAVYVPSNPPELTASICWSDKGDVCFWEDSGAPLTAPEDNSNYTVAQSPTTLTPFSKGSPLAPCTGCHRGDNLFVGHGELGDPSLKRFPATKLVNAVGPKEWQPPTDTPPEQIQCAEGCHKVAQPGYDYCALAINMMRGGLMLGTKFGLKAALAATTSESSEALDAEECTAWHEFLKICSGELHKTYGGSGGEVPEDLQKLFSIDTNLGRCVTVVKK